MTRATSASVRLFVYGSLKRGERHHDELQAAGATFLGEAETAPGYRLETLNDYLALVPLPHPAPTDVVQGELYQVPAAQLPALDAFEGDAYIRGRVEIRLLVPGAAKPRHQDRSAAGAAKPRHQDRSAAGAAKPRHQDGPTLKLRVRGAVEESLAYFKKAR